MANLALASALISWALGLAVFFTGGARTDPSPLLWAAGLTFVLNTTAIVLARRTGSEQSDKRKALSLRAQWAVFLGAVGYLGTIALLIVAAATDFVETVR